MHYFAGIDVSLEQSSVFVVDATGKILQRRWEERVRCGMLGRRA